MSVTCKIANQQLNKTLKRKTNESNMKQTSDQKEASYAYS